jgi:hypothetical protein
MLIPGVGMTSLSCHEATKSLSRTKEGFVGLRVLVP